MAITTRIFDACGTLADGTAAAPAPASGPGCRRPAHLPADLTGLPARARGA